MDKNLNERSTYALMSLASRLKATHHAMTAEEHQQVAGRNGRQEDVKALSAGCVTIGERERERKGVNLDYVVVGTD